ncbi:DoxX family protein [Corynebacterium macclintockiae]|uniref:DoxX family protein n=1 Tax=Corynebacterium macclintockiae TaxID=2913501 RepID=UPI00254F0721|nr:DoxX family protein [Corynebacterium macclintockiae]MDK8869901.1 DoxX family protein [Corynebacterium macclintockiae]
MLNHPAARDTALLFVRLVTGVIFIAHGWKKVFIDGMNGVTGTVATFERLHIPQPKISAWAAAILEMLGGAMLIVGLLTTAVAGLFVIYSALILYVVHWSNGFFVADGGMEFVMLLVVSLMMIVVFGAGRASLDKALSRFG